MPQKRNPISSEVILAQSKILRAQAGLLLDGMITDFERASGPWHLEWAAIPTAFISVVGSLHQADFALSGLQVNEDAMLSNLRSTKGLIVAEAVMMSLANSTGRQEAHEIVYRACVSAHEGGRSLLEALQDVPIVVKNLEAKALAQLCDPTRYLGTCQAMVDELLEQGTTPAVNGNGHSNGHAHGHSNGHSNGHVNGESNGHSESNGVTNGVTNGNGLAH